MEERAAFSSQDPRFHQSRLESNNRRDDDDNEDYSHLPLPPPPGHPMPSYVVQMPKNQVYRVPPPENAQIVQNYREAAAAKKPKQKTSCRKYCVCVLVFLFLICLMIGGAFVAVYFIFKPKGPVFTVSSLVVKQHKGGPPTYDVKLQVKNPNDKMGIRYKSAEDDSKLRFSDQTLAWGRSARLEQKKGRESNSVNINFKGVKDEKMPSDVQKSMDAKKKKHEISLSLEIDSPLVFNVWELKMWKRDMVAKCKFRVSTMGEGTKILSQQCHTKLS